MNTIASETDEMKDWKDAQVKEYNTQFDVSNDSKKVLNKEQTVLFFREAFVFWYKKQEALNIELKSKAIFDFTSFELFKVRYINFQITCLNKKLKTTDISIEELEVSTYL